MSSIYAPCHCNSGKKWKFCCHEFTQELLRGDSGIKRAQTCAQLPLNFCVKGINSEEQGLTSVLIARKRADDLYLVGIYLLDVWCLGLKTAELFNNVSLEGIQALMINLRKSYSRIENVSYEGARGLILGAIAYAGAIELEPHPAWSYAQYLIEPDRHYTTDFVFGRDGKPLYINGPYDNNIEEVITKVSHAGGHFIVRLE